MVFDRSLIKVPSLPRIITKKELRQIVPYSAQHILRLEKKGIFPKRIVIGPGRVGWRLADIEQWLAERASSTASARMPECSSSLE